MDPGRRLPSAGGGLLRVSDFCRRRPTNWRRFRQELFSEAESVGRAFAREVDDSEEEGWCIHVHILSACPLTSTRKTRSDGRRRRLGKIREPSVRRDQFATVYAEDDLLSSMEVFEGQICALYSLIYRDCWAPVVLRVLPPLLRPTSNCGRNALPQPPKLFVPPCVAAATGLFDFAPRHLRECARIQPIQATTPFGGSPAVRYGARVPHAKTATLREIGRPAPDLVGLDVLIVATNLEGTEENERGRQEEALRSYFFDSVTKEDHPRLLVKGSVIAVPDFLMHPSGHAGLQPRSKTRFYEVVHIEPGEENVERSDGSAQNGPSKLHLSDEPATTFLPCFAISPKTELTLQECKNDASGNSRISHRLPQPSMAEAFSRSVFNTLELAERGRGNQESSVETIVPSLKAGRRLNSHPSVERIVNALLLPSAGSSSFSLSDRCLHIIGTEDDNTNQCLDAAADVVGMRVLHVDGLATFAFQYRTMRGEQKAAFASTGGISDKVAGLGYALDLALESAPCVFHVCRFDRELTPGDDHDTRKDEEGRLLACITEALRKSQHQWEGGFGIACGRVLEKKDSVRSVPPLLVVVSSAGPLPEGGPLSSFLTCEPAFILHPDETYARQLWNDGGEGGNNIFEEAKPHLIGRTAAEISFVRQRFVAATKAGLLNGEPTTEVVSSIIKELEDGPTEGAGGPSSTKLANALVPNVRWEDVGGLSHVRSEVTDAVELPLRYPHLFRHSGGRSGLLLFGPPGTGKTLVAKAVATECGLPFLSVKGPELLGSYVGESEANIRATFAAARESAAATAGLRLERGEMAGNGAAMGGCAILFFDELDSLAPRRGGVGDGGGVMERVVATLLGELDGAASDGEADSDRGATLELGRPSSKGSVFVIGATNRPDLLDPSLLRPGRFDRLVYLGPAREKEDRVRILLAQTRKFHFEEGADPKTLLGCVVDSLPPTLSGADLSAISKGALMRSLKRLCEEAEEEAAIAALNGSSRRFEGGDVESTTVEEIIAGWDKDQLQPVVTIGDFITAAKEVSPSVTEEDLAGYEELRKQFCA